jgi:hypothetical protein
MVTSRSKVTFWPDGSTRPLNYGWLFVYPDRRKPPPRCRYVNNTSCHTWCTKFPVM